jgi:hypothetical protein
MYYLSFYFNPFKVNIICKLCAGGASKMEAMVERATAIALHEWRLQWPQLLQLVRRLLYHALLLDVGIAGQVWHGPGHVHNQADATAFS